MNRSITTITMSLLLLLAPVTAFATVLDTMCLSTSSKTLLGIFNTIPGSGQIVDSIGISIDSLQVKGTCDSVSIVYPIRIGTFTIYYPVAVLKKANSCTLSVVYLTKDTSINMCLPIATVNPLAAGHNRSSGFTHAEKSDHGFVLSWNTSEAPIAHIVCIGLDGAVMYSSAIGNGIESVFVPLAHRTGTVVVVGATESGKRIVGRVAP